MSHRGAVLAVAIVLAAASPTFAAVLVTPPITVPQPNPSSAIQCAATNLDVLPLTVTLEILDRFGTTIVGPTAVALNPLNTTTIFQFNPAAPPFVCRYTFVGKPEQVIGTAEGCSFTGVGGGIFDCHNTTTRTRP